MTYRSLLVLLDHTPGCGGRTGLALGLARRLDCHLVGLAPTDLIDLPVVPKAAATLNDYAAAAWDAMRDQAERAADAFRDACHAAGVKSFEAVIDEAHKVESLVRHAHCSDLTVLSQADPCAPDSHLTRAMVESVVLHSARPTLIVPHSRQFDSLGRRIMVAWDDSREASRALSDALPLLQRADDVEVTCWTEGEPAAGTSIGSRIDAIHQWLMWHGVTARTRVRAGGARTADTMLTHAADLGADLIVMGAYGHSRWTERVLGGATRGMLSAMTVPVLMSH